MLRLVALLTLVHSVVGDECFIFQRNSAASSPESASDSDMGSDEFASFCNHDGTCQDLYISDSGDLQIGEGGALFHPLSCQEAFARLNPLRLLPIPAMPNVEILRNAEVAWSKAVDEEARMLADMFNSDPRTDDDDLTRFLARQYPRKFAVHMNAIVSALGEAAEAILISFPRVNQLGLDPTWIGDLGTHVDAISADLPKHHKRIQTLSMFRTSDEVRTMVFCVNLILQRMMTERDEAKLAPFVAAVSPFLHAFWYIQASLSVHFPNLYDGMQAALVMVTQTTLPDDAWEWELALAPKEVDAWSHPELPLMRSMTDWNQVLLDVKVVPDLKVARATLADLLMQMIASDDDAFLIETGKRVAILFAYLDAHDVDIADICIEFWAVANGFLRSADSIPVGVRIQTRASVLSRCKPVLDIRARLSQVRVITVTETHRTQLWLAREDPVQSLISRLASNDPHRLAGQLLLTIAPSAFADEEESTALPGGVAAWFAEAISQLFSDDSELFTEHRAPDNCVFYRPFLIGDAEADRDRQVGFGHFLGLYLRQGFDVANLIPVMRSCHEADVSTVMFFGSDAIRSGFYDIFMEGDFERALIDAKDVETMLQFLASQPPGFFGVGKSGIVTA